MRILVVAPQPFFQERGTPIAVRLLVETLCDFGNKVDLLVYHEGTDIAYPGLRLFRAPRPPGVRHVPIGVSLRKLVCDVGLIARMILLLLLNDYEVVHAVEEAVFPAAFMLLFSHRKLVYDMDSSLSDQLTDKWRILRPLKRVLSLFERGAIRRSTAVLAVCEDLAVKARAWKDPSQVIVLPDVPMGNPVDPGATESLHDIAGGDAVIAVYVGNLERYQGIDLLVEAMARLGGDSKVRMIVIGGQPADVDHYRERSHRLGMVDRLHFLGARPVAQLNTYLEQADVLVSPRTLGQNTPMKVYSYMQSGKAILATAIRSHTQALDESCACLVAPEPEALASGLERLAGDRALRDRLGAAARAKAEREYSLPVFRAKLQRAYELVRDA